MSKFTIILIALLVSLSPMSFAASDTEATLRVRAGGTFQFEGATDDAYEATIVVPDPTSDVNITLGNDVGTSVALVPSTLTTNSTTAANSIFGVSNGLGFEGATADGFESTLTVADITTPDKTHTLPDTTGYVAIDTAGTTAGNVLVETEIDASSELLAIMDDETGTGLLVFATTPTLTTPVIGAATGTSLSVSGSVLSTSATTIGWSVVAGADTACSTTCTNACVVGFDDGAADAENMVDCASATADKCLCAGAN